MVEDAGPAASQRRDAKIAIYVPSRFGSGEPIPQADIEHQARVVAGALSRFGGASAEQIVQRATNLVGTWREGSPGAGQLVDERILKVWTAVTRAQLEDAEGLREVELEARRLRDALRQEAILLEWGHEVILARGGVTSPARADFASHSRVAQEDFALMAWCRVEAPEGLAGVLSLAGWERSAPGHAVGAGHRVSLATTRKGQVRTAWAWCRDGDPSDDDLQELAPGDLLVQEVREAKLRAWLRTGSGVSGPRDIPMATSQRPTTRLAIEFALALLEGTSSMPLEQLLDVEGATARFYRDVRDLIGLLATRIEGKRRAGAGAQQRAQRLVGRLLFLRFIEEKGWLEGSRLREGWTARQGTYCASFLEPLFRALDTPQSARPAASPRVPYLNGGLFSASGAGDTLDLPDACFDLDHRGSVLEVLYRYQFTLDELAGREQVVSVDPALLGRVLESLTPGEERKSHGVHYTPAAVGRALAVGGIYPQVVRHLKARGIEGIDVPALTRLVAGDWSAVGETASAAIQEILHRLRIVDPAVGSGALLVACLEVMLELEAACERRQGGDLRKGTAKWSQAARGFVRDCLFGVDISPEAVEVAQLRLWLFLAVGEASPSALPDLGYNLRVGDSLAFDDAEARLARELESGGGTARGLEFEPVDRSLNQVLDALAAFRRASDQAPDVRVKAFRALEEAERSLRSVLGGRTGRAGEAPPFAWSVHFAEVFRGDNRGFDLVIANPPYVASRNLPEDMRDDLKRRYHSMASKNVDLFYAFIERCLRPPAPATGAGLAEIGKKAAGYGLAGRAGGLAFIMPSFAQTQSAKGLRELLGDGGHVLRWVDFVGHQVFPTAANYVALLFATAHRSQRKTFEAQVVTPDAFRRMRAGDEWLEGLPAIPVPYQPDGWNVRPQPKPPARQVRPLGELVSVQVGIQTSLDSFYLLDEVRPGSSAGLVVVRNETSEAELERGALFACAKGSRHLRGAEFRAGCHVLWPYREDGSLMDARELEQRYPRAWALFLGHRPQLEAREKGKLAGEGWWRFRRPQGVGVARQPKVLVPAMMKEPSAFLDAAGAVICTASGNGGGGGWVLQPAVGTRTDLARLAAFLRSAEFGLWLQANAEAKRGGWWGVDRRTLSRCPVPEGAIA